MTPSPALMRRVTGADGPPAVPSLDTGEHLPHFAQAPRKFASSRDLASRREAFGATIVAAAALALRRVVSFREYSRANDRTSSNPDRPLTRADLLHVKGPGARAIQEALQEWEEPAPELEGRGDEEARRARARKLAEAAQDLHGIQRENVLTYSRLLRKIDDARRCGQWARVRIDRVCGAADLDRAQRFHCDVRGCPTCDRIRSEELLRFRPVIEAAIEKEKHLAFWTFTVPNVETLFAPDGKRAATLLSKCFAELLGWLRGDSRRAPLQVCYRCKLWVRPLEGRGSRSYVWETLTTCSCGEDAKPYGVAPRASLRSIEITFRRKVTVCVACGRWAAGQRARQPECCTCDHPSFEERDAGWHPHVHALVEAPFIPQAALAELWTAITRKLWYGGAANGMGTDVRRVRDHLGRAAGSRGFELGSALKELLKYPTKVDGFLGDGAAFLEWYEGTRGTRLVAGSGAWFGVFSREDDDDDQEDEGPERCPHCGSVAEWVSWFVELRDRERDKGARRAHERPRSARE